MKGSRTKYSSGFDPKLVPGCTLWLDAADSSTLTLSGSNVTQWRDKANGVVMTTQGTLANLTRTQTGINGRPSVFLNNAASDSVYMSGTLSNQLTGTAFYVIKAYSQRTVDWRPFVTWFNSAQFPAYGYLGSTTVDTVGPYTTYASPNGTPTQVLTPGSTYLISYGWTGTTTTVTTNGSTVQTGSQQPYSSSTTTLWLGADGPSAEVRITLDYGEVLFFDRVVSTAERQQLEGYLAWKWGLRATLEGSHPFRYGPASVLPTQISGCALWLDAADATTLTLSGSNVSVWADKSGNGRNATQSTGTRRPLYQTNQRNGLPTLQWDGVDDNLSGSFPYPSNGLVTLFVVYNVAVTTGDLRVWDIGGNYYGNFGSPQGGLNADAIVWLGGSEYPASAFYTQLAPTTGWKMYTVSYAGMSTRMWRNGVSLTLNGSGANPTPTGTTYTLGNNDGGANSGVFNGQMAEVIVYMGTLSSTQRQQVEGYLAWKWGLQTNLPTSPHPYGSLPPTLRLFGPMDVSGCSLWLDAADASTLSFNGSNVTQWRDKSGTGNHYASGGGITYSNQALVFPGNATLSNTNPINFSAGASPSMTTFAVVSVTETAQERGIFQYGQISCSKTGYAVYVFSNKVDCTLYCGDLMVNNAIAPNTVTMVSDVVTASGTPGALSRAGWFNGAPMTTTNVSTTGVNLNLNSSSVIGNVANGFFSGTMHEILYFNRALSTLQRQQIEGYLARKWRLQPSIAVGHPYRFGLPALLPGLTPVAIPGCALWLDAADRSTLTLSGSNVTAWADKSGSSNHMTVSPFNVTNPTYSATTGVSFNNSALHTNAGIQTMCAFAVYAQSDTGAIVSGTTSGAGTSRIYFGVWLGNYNLYNVPTAGGTNTVNNNTSFSSSALFVGSYIFDGSNVTAFANGTSTSNTAFSGTPGTSTNVILGGDVFNGSISRKVFSIRELILYTTATPPYERRQIEGYLAWKWGLQGNLPFSHTFRMIKP